MAKGDEIKSATDGLNGSPGHLMHRALQLMLDVYVAEAGADAPTHRQYVLLEAAGAGEGLSQTDLVRRTGIDRSTLAELAARMTTRGWLTRERSAADGRAKTVVLSDEGRAVLESVRPAVAAADRRVLALLPRRKREAFVDILAELAEAADAGPDRRKAELKAAKKAEKLAKKDKKAAKQAKKAARAAEPVEI